MPSNPFKNSFTKQFRPDPIIYSCGTETCYQNLVFRTLGINEKEVFTLGKSLAPQLNDNALIHRMMVKVINTNAPHIERLTGFVQQVKEELSANACAEPYTARYYQMLTEVLTTFDELVNDFQQNGNQLLCDKLTECFTGEINANNNEPACSDAVKNLYTLTEDYLYQIGEYFEYFHMLLQKESEANTDDSRVQVMTYVAYYLDTLITCTEKLIINTESTLDMLSEWQTTLDTRERQELFN
jgi:hypothetical protein